MLRTIRGFVRFVVSVALISTAQTARAAFVLPASSRLGPPVQAAKNVGICGKFTDFAAEPFLAQELASLDGYAPLVTACTLGGTSQATASLVKSLATLDLSRQSAVCVSPGDFPGGADWPILPSGKAGAARIQGFLNVAGQAGAPVTWTVFVAGNDAVRVAIGGEPTPQFELSWASKNWKKSAFVTFPEPGVYAIEILWDTNYDCELSPLEISAAPSEIAGFDGASCAATPAGGSHLGEDCANAFQPSAAFALLGGDVLLPSIDGESACFGCCATSDCGGSKPICDLATNTCVGCGNDADCGDARTCAQGKCVDKGGSVSIGMGGNSGAGGASAPGGTSKASSEGDGDCATRSVGGGETDPRGLALVAALAGALRLARRPASRRARRSAD